MTTQEFQRRVKIADALCQAKNIESHPLVEEFLTQVKSFANSKEDVTPIFKFKLSLLEATICDIIELNGPTGIQEYRNIKHDIHHSIHKNIRTRIPEENRAFGRIAVWKNILGFVGTRDNVILSIANNLL